MSKQAVSESCGYCAHRNVCWLRKAVSDVEDCAKNRGLTRCDGSLHNALQRTLAEHCAEWMEQP